MWNLKSLYFVIFARYACIGRFYSFFLLFQGLTLSQLGTILSIAFISKTIANIAWSTGSDITMKSRYNCKYIIPVITSLISAVMSLLLFLPHYWLHYNSASIQLFVYLFIIQTIWFLFTAAEFPLILGLTMIKLSKTNDKIDYGIYRSYGAISWGLSHLIIGLCLQFEFIKLPYLIYMYIGATVLFLFNYFITFGNFKKNTVQIAEQTINYGSIETETNDDASKWATFKYIMSNPSILSVFLLLFCIGGGRDVLESYLFVFIYTKYENNPFLYGLLGISVLITVTFEIPLFFKEKFIVKHFGFRTMLIIGSICLIIRFLAYTLLTNYTLIFGFLAIEILHGLSFALIDMSMVTIGSDLFPADMQMIAQGILGTMRHGIGPFMFVLIGGIIFDKFGGDWMFRGIAMLQIIVVLVFVLFTRGNKLNSTTEMQVKKTSMECHADGTLF